MIQENTNQQLKPLFICGNISKSLWHLPEFYPKDPRDISLENNTNINTFVLDQLWSVSSSSQEQTPPGFIRVPQQTTVFISTPWDVDADDHKPPVRDEPAENQQHVRSCNMTHFFSLYGRLLKTQTALWWSSVIPLNLPASEGCCFKAVAAS